MPMDGTFKMKSGTKAGTQSLPTPMPMSSNASTGAEIGLAPDYKDQVNGIVPGYSGHMPRARDKYAGSAHGGLNSNPYSPPEKRGPQKGCVREEDVVPDIFAKYKDTVVGVMPGYTGYRPASKDVFNVSAYGGIPNDMQTGMHERAYDWKRVPAPEPPDFLEAVGGVVPGYTGHVPNAIDKHGSSHYGNMRPSPTRSVPLAQAGHLEQEVDKSCEVAFATMPGYQGHIPQARDTYGTSYHGTRNLKGSKERSGQFC